MTGEQAHIGEEGHRSMPGPDPQAASASPSPEIASQAVLERGESPVPGNSSDTPQEPPVKIASAIELTRVLRAAGLSKAAARAVVSNGWKGLQALGSPQPPEDEITALVDAMAALKAKLEEDTK